MKKVLCCLFLLCNELSYAQAPVSIYSDGKDFYIGWLYPSFNSQDVSVLGDENPQPFFTAYVVVSSLVDNQFNISYFDEATGSVSSIQSYQVAKRRSIIVPIDRTRMRMTDPGEKAEYKSMHITSKKPISVQFFSSGACSGGAYLGLPVSSLGRQYIVESYNDNPGAGGVVSHESDAGYFMVIAPFDGTTVKITPNTTTAGGKAGASSGVGTDGTPKPFSISLNRGQCYMVNSSGGQAYYDISGSTVESNNPIAVIAGHQNANIAGGSIGGFDRLDARDFMVEQMIPVEYWDTTGYISMPFVDATNAQGGDGDEYRVFYAKPSNAPSNYPQQSIVSMKPGTLELEANPFPAHIASTIVTGTPVSFSSINGTKFHVAQYDQRMQGTAPNPAPSQMSIIPRLLWNSTYIWYVPASNTPQEAYQAYYMNVICNRSDYNNGTLQWGQDGGQLVSLKTAGTVSGEKQIPGDTALIGITVKLTGGRAYYVTSTTHTKFIIYQYGYRAIDVNKNLGGNDESNFYYSYALPVGFGAVLGYDSIRFSATTDTNCAKWNMCLSVIGNNHPILKAVTILNDPDEDIVDKPNSNSGYVSYNVRFDPKNDPDGKGEINLSGADSSYCVGLYVQNPLDSAYAAILVVDNNGNYHVYELRYKLPRCQIILVEHLST
jgi:hypothetical protein